VKTKESSRVWLITGSAAGFGRHLGEAVLAQGDRRGITEPPVRLAIGPSGLPRLIEKLSSDIE
jgi:NAD(P)-dependent dehydrogenase (short-subunit alcohol dehydrogenase family)